MGTLVSRVEIADRLGVTPQRVYQLIKEGGFPEPLIVLAVGEIWEWESVAEWARKVGRLPDTDERL